MPRTSDLALELGVRAPGGDRRGGKRGGEGGRSGEGGGGVRWDRDAGEGAGDYLEEDRVPPAGGKRGGRGGRGGEARCPVAGQGGRQERNGHSLQGGGGRGGPCTPCLEGRWGGCAELLLTTRGRSWCPKGRRRIRRSRADVPGAAAWASAPDGGDDAVRSRHVALGAPPGPAATIASATFSASTRPSASRHGSACRAGKPPRSPRSPAARGRHARRRRVPRPHSASLQPASANLLPSRPPTCGGRRGRRCSTRSRSRSAPCGAAAAGALRSRARRVEVELHVALDALPAGLGERRAPRRGRRC